MSPSICIACRRPKATLKCEICGENICRDCEQFLEADRFSFLNELPQYLTFTHYCPSCFDSKVAPELEAYDQIMEKARGVYVFFTSQKRPVATLKRAKETVTVSKCADRDETILRLAFQAAKLGFNAVIDADVRSSKVRNEGYQTSVWSAEGMPAMIDQERLERQS